jgi:hypothetical protein
MKPFIFDVKEEDFVPRDTIGSFYPICKFRFLKVGPYGFFFGNVDPDGFRDCIIRNCSKS